MCSVVVSTRTADGSIYVCLEIAIDHSSLLFEESDRTCSKPDLNDTDRGRWTNTASSTIGMVWRRGCRPTIREDVSVT